MVSLICVVPFFGTMLLSNNLTPTYSFFAGSFSTMSIGPTSVGPILAGPISAGTDSRPSPRVETTPPSCQQG
jgi:hypothetical protein